MWSVPAYLRMCAPWLSPDEVRKLRRKDPGLTLRVYAHLMPSSQERTRKGVAAAFETAQPNI